MMQRAEFEPIHALDVFQQQGLFFGGRFQPPFGVFGAFHHLGGFVTDEAAVRAEAELREPYLADSALSDQEEARRAASFKRRFRAADARFGCVQIRPAGRAPVSMW